MSHQVAVAELTEAREKLRAAEGELATAKAALDAVKDGDDAQQIVKAEAGVAEAKLGVAEAKLGVAKAELGVAKAEWQAATDEGQRDRLGRLVDTAQKSVESAQKIVDAATMAYQNALRAAAPPHESKEDGDMVDKMAALFRQERAEQQRLAKEEREQEICNRLVRVTLRKWEGGTEVHLFASPSSIYQRAGHTFSLESGSFTLYVLSDATDFSTRMKLDGESPIQTALVLSVSPPPIVLVYARPPNDTSPARPPARLPEIKGLGGAECRESSESSGSRGQQQAEFRVEVMKAAGWRDYLTGASIQQRAGEDGQPGEACHIIPVAKGPGALGNQEARRDLLKKLGQQPNLYITANGIPLLTDFHQYFDSLELSINTDKDYEICVWNVPASATKVHQLKGMLAALKKTPWIACKPLLKWHHQKCIDKHPAQQVMKGEG